MPRIVVIHRVEDVERWLEGKSARATMLGRYATDVQDYVSEDGTNQVALTLDVHDMEGLRALASSPPEEDAAGMKQRGVIPPMTVFVER